MRLKCKTHDVILEWDEEKRTKRLQWEYGKNVQCILLTAKIEELREGEFGDCEVVKL